MAGDGVLLSASGGRCSKSVPTTRGEALAWGDDLPLVVM